MRNFEFDGIALDGFSPKDAWAKIIEKYDRAPESGYSVSLVNANTFYEIKHNPAYRNALIAMNLRLIDSTPLAFIMRNLPSGSELIAKCPGPELFALALHSDQRHVPHYLVGATEDVLRRLRVKFEKAGLQVQTFSPAFTSDISELERQVNSFLDGKPRGIVWVGLGGMKQDFVSQRIGATTTHVCIGVGAAFDFEAGTLRRAPKFYRNLGLEWVFRLSQEPRRLWKRYLFGNSNLLKLALAELLARTVARFGKPN